MNPQHHRRTLYFAILFLFATVRAGAGQGIPIVPGDDGRFEYRDDFSTPKVLLDAFVAQDDVEMWAPGQLVSAGPVPRRQLVYRFYGDHPIRDVEVSVEQMSNARHLGGVTHLEVSDNGVDWTRADSSARFQPDANAWQTGALVFGADSAEDFAGRSEFWLRLTLENHSGLTSYTSNIVKGLLVLIAVDPDTPAMAAGVDSAEQAWGALRASTSWHTITLDCRDPGDGRAPHYYEDVDGWLVDAASHPLLHPDETDGFPISRRYDPATRSATGLGVFVDVGEAGGPLMARIVVNTALQGFRRLAIHWDGEIMGTFDTASCFDAETPFYVELTPGEGTHELRITAEDTGQVLIRRIEIAGASVRGWVSKPALAAGGPLEVVSASYLPDPAPRPIPRSSRAENAPRWPTSAPAPASRSSSCNDCMPSMKHSVRCA